MHPVLGIQNALRFHNESSKQIRDFDEGGEPVYEASGTFRDGDSWEPHDAVKGDVARAAFYRDVRYDGSDGRMPDLVLRNDTDSAVGQPAIGVLCTLYRWHWQDPVDVREQRRNDRVQERQGNRNPFIDHPDWVRDIYAVHCGEHTSDDRRNK